MGFESRTIGVAVYALRRIGPAAELALIAARAGAAVVEINPSTTALTAHADLVIHAPAGEVLPDLLRRHERNVTSGVTL